MGRHGRMSAAEPPEEPEDERERLIRESGAEIVPKQKRVRKLTDRVVEHPERLSRLRVISIERPEGPLRTAALDRAARIVERIPYISDSRDDKLVRTIARYLYDEAVFAQFVDEERALTRKAIDRWISESSTLSSRSKATYASSLYEGGRVLYPREFPEPRNRFGKRKLRMPATSMRKVRELYAIAPSLPLRLNQRMLLILDLTTGVGLRSEEIRDLCGSDISVLTVSSGQEIVVVTVWRRGEIDRQVPVICPLRGQRLLDRARQVGEEPMLPVTEDGTVSRNLISRTSREIKKLGYFGLEATPLRHRWVVELSKKPIPPAAFLRLAGVNEMRVLAEQGDLLPSYTLEQLADLLMEQEDLP